MRVARNKIPQTQKEYMEILKKGFKKLTPSDREDALRYFEEYFADAGEENYHEVANRLGPPEEVAFVVASDKIFERLENEPPTARNGFNTALAVIIGICAAPIAAPIALMLVAMLLMIFGLVVMVLVLLAGFLVLLGGFALGTLIMGLYMLVISVPVMFTSVATAVFLIGFGILSLGVTGLLVVATYYCGKVYGLLLIKVFGSWIPSFLKKVIGLFRRRATA